MLPFDMFNFRTRAYETLPDGDIPVARIPEFLPQYPAAQHLYTLYLEMGGTALDAMLKVLKDCLQKE
jgi:hypothetical protein